jgi:hypothetical protein
MHKNTLHFFCFQGKEDGKGGWSWHKQYWVDQIGFPHGSRQLSLQVLNPNNTFNGFKASGRVLRLLLVHEEYGVTFEYLPGKTKTEKNNHIVAKTVSCLAIDILKIQEEEA